MEEGKSRNVWRDFLQLLQCVPYKLALSIFRNHKFRLQIVYPFKYGGWHLNKIPCPCHLCPSRVGAWRELLGYSRPNKSLLCKQLLAPSSGNGTTHVPLRHARVTVKEAGAANTAANGEPHRRTDSPALHSRRCCTESYRGDAQIWRGFAEKEKIYISIIVPRRFARTTTSSALMFCCGGVKGQR